MYPPFVHVAATWATAREPPCRPGPGNREFMCHATNAKDTFPRERESTSAGDGPIFTRVRCRLAPDKPRPYVKLLSESLFHAEDSFRFALLDRGKRPSAPLCTKPTTSPSTIRALEYVVKGGREGIFETIFFHVEKINFAISFP